MTTPEPDHRARIAAVVLDTVAAILPGVPRERITERRHPAELGADSVDRVEIVLGLLDRLGMDEPMSSFGPLSSIGALVDFLAARTAGDGGAR